MSTFSPAKPSPHFDHKQVPPLQNGDRLTRDEFERRYALMGEDEKAELIEGVVYMAAALSAGSHGIPHARIMTWLGVYSAATAGVLIADNSTVRLDLDNEPQPDACAFIDASHGGRVKMSPEQFIEGSPELVVEVAASSVSIDLNQKLNTYRRNGVREYVVLRTYDGELDWFVLTEGQFVRSQPDGQGVYRSAVFPGLWLKAEALIAGDIAAVLGTLQLGIASPEHESFVKQLSGAAQK